MNFLGCHRFDLGLKEKDVPVFYHCRRVDYLYRSRTPLSIGLAYAFDNASPPCSEIKRKVFFYVAIRRLFLSRSDRIRLPLAQDENQMR